MAATIEIKYYNSFWLKRIDSIASTIPSNFDNVPRVYDGSVSEDWYIEEARIRGGYNNTSVDFGVKAYAVEETQAGEVRPNALIYSGIYNSKTGINNTNQFPVGSEITKAADPAYGSIQKLY